MNTNELLTLQKYASLNRLSTHAVIKKTMNGELQTVIKEENGKEITYILNPEIKKTEVKTPRGENDIDETCEINYKKEYEDLHKQFLVLKTKYEKLLGQ
ncbi:MAG: hypothetical protein QG558_976 [Campylobacterota bacterium]|nr:hypothetical protein [Campylobacterota bacterium]